MKKPTDFLIAIGVMVIIVGWLFVHSLNGESFAEIFSLEPKYEGHTFNYWMHHWQSESWGGPINAQAKLALQTMGSKAAPELIDWIKRQPTEGLNFNYPGHALQGFEVLGPVAKPAIPDLIKMLGEFGHENYPEQALVCIGKDAVPALVDKLTETLANTNKPIMNWREPGYETNFFSIQGCVIRVLNQMGTNAETAVPVLIKCLNANISWHQSEAASALANVGRNQLDIVIPALIHAFTNSCFTYANQEENLWQQYSTRRAVSSALGSIGERREKVVIPFLMTALTSYDVKTADRGAVAAALAEVGHKQPDVIIPALIYAFSNSPSQAQVGIAHALATFEGNAKPAVPLLLLAGQSEDWELRNSAAIAVIKIAPGTPNALSPLIKNLDCQDVNAREQAMYELGKLGTNAVEALPALAKYLANTNSQTRINTMRCIQGINQSSDEIINALGDNLSCTNSFVSIEAEELLGQLAASSKLAFTILIKNGMNTSTDAGVRQQSKEILIDISRRDPQFMLECLDDSNVNIRSGALRVFYMLERAVPDSIPKLQQIAKNDPDLNVRTYAADVLRLQQR